MKFLYLFLLLIPTSLFAQEATPSFISKAVMYFDFAAQLCFTLAIAATIITRLTPKKKDDELVAAWIEKMTKMLSYLPTFGINPRTKELEKALAEAKEKK